MQSLLFLQCFGCFWSRVNRFVKQNPAKPMKCAHVFWLLCFDLLYAYNLKVGICIGYPPGAVACGDINSGCSTVVVSDASLSCSSFNGLGMFQLIPVVSSGGVLAYDVYAYPGASSCSSGTPFLKFPGVSVDGKCMLASGK